MSASDDDDGGIPIFPIGPTWGNAGEATRQFSSETAAFLRSFAKNPVGFIFSAISLYLLEGLFGIFGVIVGSVLSAYNIVVGVLGVIQETIIAFFAFIGLDILSVLFEVQFVLAGLVDGAGPAGPVVAVAIAGGGTYLVYRAGSYILAVLNPA